MYVGLLSPEPGLYMKNHSKSRYVYALLIVGGATVVSKLLLPHFVPVNLVMIYLLAVVVVSTKLGRGPAVLASLVSVCIFDFFCIEPYLTFAVSDSQYLLTFCVMLTTALVISNLTATATEQAERAMQLYAENEQARMQVKSEQLRSSLLSSISHDLRTPLATITGAASSIVEAGSDVKISECKELATEIFVESRRLNRLVGNLLDMTRLESGALEIHKEPQPVDEIIGSVISYFSDQLDSRIVETEIPEGLPMISGDAVLIQQLLINLMENVFKYTPPDSPLLFKASIDGEFVLIELNDRGPGIPREMHGQIFQKFVRATTRSGAGGAGLGLAICQGITEVHGGKLGVKERDGGGCSFWFTLPVDRSKPMPQQEMDAVQASI